MQQLLAFIILYTFWIIWSGKFYPFYLLIGAVCVLMIIFWFGDLIVVKSKRSLQRRIYSFFRFELYSVWLLWEIVKANIHVVKVSFSRDVRASLEPRMLEFKTTLKTDMQKFLLAQSITLTPGTVSVRINNDVFLVHAITEDTANGVPGEMESRIKNISKGN
ncbi:cation transporter [Candidatus Marinamargulisbacteria bacterium SCGC AG-410-N11]|nr:cation transporter [Candidatus Marinamargulisbacteria bacterium SCGC AG-410-N11]